MRKPLLVVMVCVLQFGVLCLAEMCITNCKKDPKMAVDYFDQQIKAWFDFLVPYRKNLINQMDKILQEMKKNPSCIAKYYRTYTAHDFAIMAAPVFGLVPVRHNEAPWRKNPDASKEEICKYLEVQGTVVLENAKDNLKRLIKCKVYDWFKMIFFEPWRECNEKCKDDGY